MGLFMPSLLRARLVGCGLNVYNQRMMCEDTIKGRTRLSYLKVNLNTKSNAARTNMTELAIITGQSISAKAYTSHTTVLVITISIIPRLKSPTLLLLQAKYT